MFAQWKQSKTIVLERLLHRLLQHIRSEGADWFLWCPWASDCMSKQGTGVIMVVVIKMSANRESSMQQNHPQLQHAHHTRQRKPSAQSGEQRCRQ